MVAGTTLLRIGVTARVLGQVVARRPARQAGTSIVVGALALFAFSAIADKLLVSGMRCRRSWCCSTST